MIAEHRTRLTGLLILFWQILRVTGRSVRAGQAGSLSGFFIAVLPLGACVKIGVSIQFLMQNI